MTISFGSTALAADSLPNAQSEIRTALSNFDLNITGERVNFAKRGRRDLVLSSTSSKMAVSDRLIHAYRTRQTLPNGWKVKGWAHLVQTDSYTFTLAKDRSESFVAEVVRDGSGSKIKLWGASYKYRPQRKPLSEIPRRYVRPAGSTVVR